MDRPGEKLKRIRERLKLTYRDVERASQIIAERMKNPEFTIALSRLADIENKGTVPTIYRLYTLCAVYRLDYFELLSWYGAPLDRAPSEWLQVGLDATHEIQPARSNEFEVPDAADFAIDPNQTTFLNYIVRNWGPAPLHLLRGANLKSYRYGLIGLEDRSMSPVLRPGALVVIDNAARVASGGWNNESDRPIYFFETREGYLCGWCDLIGDRLIVLPHPASCQKPSVFRFPGEIDLVGEVVGVAMQLGSGRTRHSQSALRTAQ